MFDNELFSRTSEIINENLLAILSKLGFREMPENLSLKISQEYGQAYGLCLALFKDEHRSQLLEAVVVLYPSNMLWLKVFDWLHLPRLCMFSRRLFKRRVLHVLAHELRHFWQYYSGEHREYHRLSQFLPRSMRLVELDADRWAEDYLLVYGANPRLAGLSM